MKPITPQWERYRGVEFEETCRFMANDSVITLRAGRMGHSFFWECQRGGTLVSGIDLVGTLGEAKLAAEIAWRDWAKATAEAAGWTVLPPEGANVPPVSPTPTVIVGSCGLVWPKRVDPAELRRILLTEDDLAAGFVDIEEPRRDVNSRGYAVPFPPNAKKE